jgi:hypothetical protein
MQQSIVEADKNIYSVSSKIKIYRHQPTSRFHSFAPYKNTTFSAPKRVSRYVVIESFPSTSKNHNEKDSRCTFYADFPGTWNCEVFVGKTEGKGNLKEVGLDGMMIIILI